jgi:hypothetical protein
MRNRNCKRTPDYILKKIENKDAVIALDNGVFAGFVISKVGKTAITSHIQD